MSAEKRGKTVSTVKMDAENPEWTKADFARAKGPESLPPEVLAAFPRTAEAVRRRGKQKSPVKHAVSLRLDQTVIDHFRATGSGWQSRINETLKKAIS
jgi:uncharacterized protein (DUF4415 family)